MGLLEVPRVQREQHVLPDRVPRLFGHLLGRYEQGIRPGAPVQLEDPQPVGVEALAVGEEEVQARERGAGHDRRFDPITFAVIKSALDTIVDDMAYAVMRTARSPIVRDVLDYSVTLCDAEGRILTQAKTVALHLGAVPDAMDVVIERFAGDLAPGDVIVLNDPYDGGMHLPDIFMFKPIFIGERLLRVLRWSSRIIATSADGCRAPTPATSTEIFQEGLRIAADEALSTRACPTRRCSTLIEKNVRLPDLVIGDLEAQYATCNIGERELLRLFERYGEASSRSISTGCSTTARS